MKLYESLIKGDGHSFKQKKHYKHNTDTFYQKDIGFLNWFEQLVLSLGWIPKKVWHKRGKSYFVSIKKQSTTEFQYKNYNPKWIDYKGKVWCINTNKGNFIAWRNGKYFITGNSGFPKSLNISKAVDKRLGMEREVIGKGKAGFLENNKAFEINKEGYGEYEITKPASEKAKELDGSYSGFSPKPAVEVIIVAMKPLSEKGYLDQSLNNKKGITWMEDCRIPYANDKDKEMVKSLFDNHIENNLPSQMMGDKFVREGEVSEKGRFPANLIVSDDVLNEGKEYGTGTYRGNESVRTYKPFSYYASTEEQIKLSTENLQQAPNDYGDIGSFSKYFDLDRWFDAKLPKEVRDVLPFLIVPKPSRSEKDFCCDKIEDSKAVPNSLSGGTETRLDGKMVAEGKNFHPTVKPIKLMTYLITMGSRENDIVLDPFVGSGTTAIAAHTISRKWIGIEMDSVYFKIVDERMKWLVCQKKLGDFNETY